MYQTIENPETGRSVSIYGKLGQRVLSNYINVMNGGASHEKKTLPPETLTKEELLSHLVENTWKILYDNFSGCKRNVDIYHLAEEYLIEKDDIMFSASAWGGGVWDLLFFGSDVWPPLLVLNWEARKENGRISPVEASFPYDELNDLSRQVAERISAL